MKQAEENITRRGEHDRRERGQREAAEELKVYDRLVAPFDGMITYRSVQSDPGTLITAGNTTSSRELIRVAQINVLRIFVNVPQSYALIHDGCRPIWSWTSSRARFRTKVGGITHRWMRIADHAGGAAGE